MIKNRKICFRARCDSSLVVTGEDLKSTSSVQRASLSFLSVFGGEAGAAQGVERVRIPYQRLQSG